MPSQLNQTDRPEMGFVSLGDYLNANQGSLDQAFKQADSDAAQWGTAASSGTAPGGQAGAKDLAAQFGSEAGLSGSGRFGQGDYGYFSGALNWAAHGPGYQGLSSYLSNWQPESALSGGRSTVRRPVGPAAPAAPAAPYDPESKYTRSQQGTSGAQTMPAVDPEQARIDNANGKTTTTRKQTPPPSMRGGYG